MEEKQTVINPFTGRRIVIGGRTYKFVEESLLLWLQDGCAAPRNPNSPRLYCGKKQQVPPGYSGRGTTYDCLRKGFGAGKCSVYKRFNEIR